MGFKEELQKLSIQIGERMVHITNEEMTKQSLILPFIQVLGFDVYNPLEITPEYIADFGQKKGEKVDYAVFKDSVAIMFFEAKSVNEKLLNHDAQLCRYFNSSEDVGIGIITNGIEYRFFTDLVSANIMDVKPFLIVDMLNLKESDFENLVRFKKESFDKETLVQYAEELVYTSELDYSIKELLKNPDDEFIRYLIKDFDIKKKTSTVLDKFRPIVKKSISNAVLDIVSNGLLQQDVKNEKVDVIVDQEVSIVSKNEDGNNKKSTVTTTDDELKSFEYIKNILLDAGKDIKGLDYRDTVNYFSIYLVNSTKWFIRMNLDNSHKNFFTKVDLDTLAKYSKDFKTSVAPKSMGESRVYIDSIEDMKKLEELVIYCYDQLFV